MKLYTIHHHYLEGRYGFESSQQTRMQLARRCGIDYVHLTTSPLKSGWEARFKDIGFTYGAYINLPTWFFDEEGKFSDGEVLYSNGRAFVQDDRWNFEKEGVIYSEDDLIIKYLVENASVGDVFIRDDSRIPMSKVVRFMNNNGFRYYEYIHHRVLDNGLLPVLNRKINYLVASEVLTEKLEVMGYKVKFFPPKLLDYASAKSVVGVWRYLWSGHMGGYKNFEQVVRVFRGCPDVTVDVYGGTLSEFELFNPPENIRFMGRVDVVPYDEYDGYISTSVGEVFANACVEAMSFGLKCIVRGTDYPYVFYSRSTKGDVTTCVSDEDFIRELNYWYDKSFNGDNQRDFVEKYTFDNWLEEFRNIMKVG